MPRYLVELNNYLQKQGQSSALGWTESQTGAGNNIRWTMTCKLNGEVMGSATAHQKGAAKEEAARQTLVTLGILAEEGSAQ